MTTIIIDKNTNQPITGELTGGYIVDGAPGKLDANQVELTVIREKEPEYNFMTEKVVSQWVIDGSNYVLTHEVVAKTEAEILETKLSVTPKQITKRQMLLFMFTQMGVTNDQINAMIDGVEDATQKQLLKIEWEFATVVERENPNVIAFAAMMGINESQLLDIFYVAKDI